nr:hypothetical protein [uncultured Corynebacterium sp.]
MRGTGESAQSGDRSNRGIRMSDWIIEDVPAATRALKGRFLDAKHAAVGHSVGAHGMLVSQHEEPVKAMVMVASHAGVTKTVRTAVERAKVWAIFNVVTPVCARLMGYVPVDKLGVGKTIPLGVMLQWRRWASQGQYFFEDPEFDLAERFAKAEGPVLSVVMNDDLWVHRGAVDILTDRLDRADVVKRDIEERGDRERARRAHGLLPLEAQGSVAGSGRVAGAKSVVGRGFSSLEAQSCSSRDNLVVVRGAR